MSPVANSAFSVLTNGIASRPPRLPDPARLIVGDGWTAWRGPVVQRLENLIQLPYGWDGYSAPPVGLEVVHFTLQMLKSICPSDMCAPQIVPGTAGDLQVEWHMPSTTIELHVRSPNSVAAWRQSSNAPDGEEIELTNDFMIVLGWVREMLGDGSATVAAAA
jgi:hypothetical protein